MCKNRTGLERFIICVVLYCVYVLFTYEKIMFGGIFYQSSKFLLFIFLGGLVVQSFAAGLNMQLNFIICMVFCLSSFLFVFSNLDTAMQLGYGFWQLNRLVFSIPLINYEWINSSFLMGLSCVSYCCGVIYTMGIKEI